MKTPTPNEPAPILDFDLCGGGHWSLGGSQPEHFTMIVFYRGLHCPICRDYLGELVALRHRLAELGVEPVAVSMDPRERAEEAVREWGLDGLRVGFGLPEIVAKGWGLYISEAITDSETNRFNEPGLFLVRPDNVLHYVAINSMPFGRPKIADMCEAIEFMLERDYPARGRAA